MLDNGIREGFAKRVKTLFKTGKDFLFILEDQRGNSFAVKRIKNLIRYGSLLVTDGMRMEGTISATDEELHKFLNRADSTLAKW